MNSFYRTILQIFFSVMARFIAWDNRGQRKKFRKRFAFFYGKNALGNFPVTDFDGQKERLGQVFEKMPAPKYFALTSGTTRAPKEVPYDLKRTRFLRKTFLRSMITLTGEFPGRKTFFVFASLNKDQSLTSGMIDENGKPGHLELLQAPYRYLHTKEGRALVEKMGELSARVMVLAITQPRYLYATNPSTLTFFIKELESRWKEIRVRLKSIPPGLMKLQEGDGERRIMSFVMREKAPRLQELLPDLKAVITWDGGYVKPFLDQLKASLPGVRFLPMYSMSTESLETLPHRMKEGLAFLPLARGMFPEFREPGSEKILPTFELEAGKIFELIISDDWGLRRYGTRDLFFVKKMIGEWPDLAFVRRMGLSASLTGEKLTEDHVLELSSNLRPRFPELARVSFSLYPVSKDSAYHYELALVGIRKIPLELPRLAAEELGKINKEYAAKVGSGRLGSLSVIALSEQEFATLMGKELDWESQFKVLPLYDKTISR